VIAKAEHTEKGANPRFILTNIVGGAQKIYDQRYCARGEIENRVKEQMMLFADRVSAHRWWANQWRLLLSGQCDFLSGPAVVPGCGVQRAAGFSRQGVDSAGQRVLRNGVAGGVGSFAVQIACVFGADVTDVFNTRNVDKLRPLGVRHGFH
jgi:hypothetical protein